MSTFDPAASPTLVHVLEERAARSPDRPAFVFLTDRGRKEERLSYAEALHEVRKVAGLLRQRATRGDRVVLLYPPGLEYVTAFLGCLYAGVVALPLYPPRRNQRLVRVEEVFRNATPALALTSTGLHEGIAAFLSTAPEYAATALQATTGLDSSLADLAGSPVPTERDLAFLQYTSGSTGAPKGVMVSHGNLMANNQALTWAFGYQSQDEAFANWLPLYHDMGLIGNVLQPLYAGFLSVLMSPVSFIQSPVSWLEAISRFGATVAGAPNFAYDLCVEKVSDERLATLDLSKWRIAYNGSEPIRAATLRRFADRFAAAGLRPEALFPCYGMAEATLVVSSSPPAATPIVRHLDRDASAAHRAVYAGDEQAADAGRAIVGCGKVIPHHRVAIVDPQSCQRLAAGQIGEIWIEGPSITAGYWNHPQATAACFGARTADGDGPFLRSGDLGYFEGDELFVTGRIKELIIVRGRNYYPQDLEAAASAAHPALRDNAAAAFGVDVEGVEQVVLVQEVERGAKETEWGAVFPLILQAVADVHELSLHAIVLIRINSLPKTSSGKIQRGTARELFLRGEIEAIATWQQSAPAPIERGVAPAEEQRPVATPADATPSPAEAALRSYLRELLAEVSRRDARTLDPCASLLELGFDSLALMRTLGELRDRLGVELELPTVLDELPSIAALAKHLAQLGVQLPPPASAAAANEPTAQPERAPATSVAEIVARLMDRHMQLMELALRLLGGHAPPPPSGSAPPPPSGPGGAGDRASGDRAEAANAEPAHLCAPLSPAQERMWFFDQLQPGSAAYNIALEFRLLGALDHEALQASLAELLRRHDALRVTFARAEDGTPLQQIAAASAAPAPRLELLDWSELPPAQRAARLATLCDERAAAPFDLARGPLLRGCLVRLAALPQAEHVWLLELHHIAVDGWSLSVLLRELSELYAAHVTGRPALLRAAPRYRDQAKRQREWIGGASYKRSLAYWRSTLAGAPEALELSSDEPNGSAAQRAARVPVNVAPQLVDALRAMSQRAGATLFMTLLSAWQLLLAKMARQDDVVVGVPFSGRNAPDCADTVGLFVNTLPMRARIRPDATFFELLADTRHAALSAQAHQAVPFERIIDELGLQRDPARAPLVQALFTLQSFPPAELTLHGVTVRSGERANGQPILELDLVLREDAGALAGWLEYDTARYHAVTAERLVERWLLLLRSIVEGPAEKLEALRWLPERELTELLVERNHTARSFAESWRADATYGELFLEQAQRSPEAIAVEHAGVRWTYRQLAERAAAVAEALRACGAGRERVVALLAERDPSYLAAVLGILLCGAAYMPLDPEWPTARQLEATQQSRACVVLADDEHAASASALALAVVRLTEIDAASAPARAAPGTPLDLAYVLFTSGSTGAPKGVMIPHAAMLNQQWAKLVELSLGPTDVIAQTARQSFDISVWQLLALLLVGGRVLILRGESAWVPSALLRAMDESKVTLLETVPSHLAALLEEVEAKPRAYDLRSLRWLMPTGEALPPELCRRWFRALPHVPLVNAYGPAECADDTSLCVLRSAPTTSFSPIHGTVANVAYYVLDERLRPVPDGVAGELCIGGAGPGRGYIGQPGRTAAAFVPDPYTQAPGARMYRTGDLVRYRLDGALEFLGRIDHQVKLRGFRIELGEIEAALLQTAAVRQAVAVVRHDPPSAPRLVAYVVPALETRWQPEQLLRALSARLPAYMVPSALVALPELPLTGNGKIDRRALPPPPNDDAAEVAQPPQGATEERLAELWRELLGRPVVRRTDSFFASGGHSLAAAQMVARVRTRLGRELPLRAVFEHPTLATLAAFLDQLPRGDAPAALLGREAGATPSATAPMSFAQERLWMLQQLDPQSAVYNMSGAIELDGELDVSALERALGALVRRQEALRTTFGADQQGRGVQHLAAPQHAAIAIPLRDLRGHAAEAQRARLEELAREHGSAPFSLERGPLFRSLLIKLGPSSHVWLLALHHIIADDWSISTLFGELSELYAAQLGERAPRLPELQVQVADHARWQRRQLSGEHLERLRAFWASALAGAPEALELAADGPAPTRSTHRGQQVAVHLPASTSRALAELAQRHGATLYMALVAGLHLLLGRRCRQDDLVIGAPVANRDRDELAPLIGCFVNTIPLRARLDLAPTFAALLEQVRDFALAAYQHQELPFEHIVAGFGASGALGRPPLVQVLCTLQNAPSDELRLPGLVIRQHELATSTVKLELELSLRETSDGLVGWLEYDSDRFARSSMISLVDQLAVLLARAAEAPQRSLSELASASAAEQAQLAAWNDTAVDVRWAGCVHEHLARAARDNAAQLALVAEQGRWSYAELFAQAHRLAHHLQRHGAAADTAVALLFERTPELVVGVLGTLAAGAAYLPLDPAHPTERLAFSLRDASPSLIITTRALAVRLPSPAPFTVVLDDPALIEQLASYPAEPPTVTTTPEHLAYVLYTSGSTGAPKAAGNHHRALLNRLSWHQHHFPIGVDDRVLHKTPYTFDVSVWELLWPFLCGATMVLARDGAHGDPAYLQQVISEARITCLHFVPSMLQAFVASLEPTDATRRYPALRWIICSGEALPAALVDAAAATLGRGAEVHNLYGPTEAAIDVSHWPCAALEPVVPIGRPVANTQLHVLDEQLRQVPIGAPGELYIGGVQLARGYLARPALTAARFVPDPFAGRPGARLYRTGDLARWRGDGALEFLGRLDFQVKLRGNRIELGEIEAALRAQPGVADAVAVVREVRPGDQRLIAYWVAKPDARPAERDLRAALASKLPAAMVPGEWIELSALPLTSSGKLDRKALPAPGAAPSPAPERAGFVAPRGALAAAIAAIWAEVLGTDHIDARDHFFERGGHSLLATQVVSRMRSELFLDVPLRTLFETPVLAELAERIGGERALRRGGPDELARLPRSASGELEAPASYAQERLWVLHQLDPGGGAYHMPAAFTFSGRLEPLALRDALRALCERHEALRTTLTQAADGGVRQRVASSPPEDRLLLEQRDLRSLDEPARARAVEQAIRQTSELPFDLERGPLVRTALYRLSDEEHLWLVCLHHAIADGWSLAVLVRELGELYAAACERRAPRLPAAPVQYADYAAWQRAAAQREVLERELAFWRRELAELPDALDLPTDRPRRADHRPRGAAVERALATGLAAKLHALARSQDATLFMVMLAALQLLLARYARRADVVVGTPLAGRDRPELESTLGLFVNTVALRSRLRPALACAQWLAATRDAVLDAFSHRSAPFERVVEELGVPRERSRNPIYQVLFTLQNAPAADLALPGLSVAQRELAGATAKLDLDLTVTERDGRLLATLEYDAELYDQERCERLLVHYEQLLDSMASAPHAALTALHHLPADERALLAESRNRTTFDFSQRDPSWHAGATFGALFAARAARSPEAIAVECEGQRLTYAELASHAQRIAGALHDAGLGRESVIAVLAARGPELIAAIVGAFYAGAAYMPLDPEWPVARMRHALEQSGAGAILTAGEHQRALDELAPAKSWRLEELLAGPARAFAPLPGHPLDLAYVLFTSGSTGAPKGVMVPHGAMLNQQLAKLVLLGLGPGDTIAQTARQSFDISVWQLLAMLLVGGRVLVLRDERAWVPPLLLRELSEHGVAIFETVPSHLSLLLDELEAHPDSYSLAALRWVMPTGEALPVALCQRWFARLPHLPLVNAYGPAECADDTSLHVLRHAPTSDFAPIDGTVANVRYYVVDDALGLVPDGVPGELCIGGAGPGRGYAGDPARTAATFVPDPFSSSSGARMYRTGDLVRYRRDGRLEFLGRLDHQVKLRGLRIELGEIEEALRAFPGVRDAAVLLRQDPGIEPRLVGYVETAPSEALDERALAAALATRMPAYMVPSAWVLLGELPRTAHGKLHRAALPAPARSSARRTPLANAAERLLASLWSELLAAPELCREDHFFALGGHSLLASQLVARLRARGYQLALREVFDHPTLAALAERLEQPSADDEAPIAPRASAALEAPPLSYAQERLWFLHQLDPQSPAYNMFDAVELRGALDRASFEACLDALVARHEVLRTRFLANDDGEPKQRVAPAERRQTAAWAFADLSSLAAQDRERALEELAHEHACRPFDLATAPLFRSCLVQLAAQQHVWLVSMHHIISDDWSIAILVRELSELYAARGAARDPALPPSPLQYADYACWQRQHLAGPRLQEQLAYWRDQLAGAPASLELVTDRPRPRLKGHRGGTVDVRLDRALTRALHTLASEQGATLFMGLVAGFAVVLSRYARQREVVIGTPVANRPRRELEEVIGCFVNTLALRVQLEPRASFADVIASVRDTALAAFQHQQVPFERVVDALGAPRDLGRTPVFQAMLSLETVPLAPLELPGISLHKRDLGARTSRFDLELSLRDLAGELVGELEYDAELFDEASARAMARHFAEVLREVCAAPRARLSSLALCSPLDREQLARWSGTEVPLGGGALHERILAQAARAPELVAARCHGVELSYRELAARASALAASLRSRGAGPGALVGVLLERSVDLPVALLGVLTTGAALLPLDPELPGARLALLLRDAGASLLVTTAALAGRPHKHPASVFLLEPQALVAAPVLPATPLDDQHLAYVLYTSGSTGAPKGVEVSHRSLVSRLAALGEELALGPGDRVLHKASLSFDVSMWELFAPLTRGATVVLASPDGHRDPSYLARLVRDEAIAYLDAVPALLGPMLDAFAETPPTALRRVLCGGDTLPRALADRFATELGDGAELHNLYGPTEATIEVTSWRHRLDDPGAVVPIGRPLPNTWVHLLDEALRPVPIGMPGELYLGGVQVARGYLRQPKLTAERFVPDPFSRHPGARLYRTGDFARYRPHGDGAIEFLGRRDHQVKLRGQRLELAEIEAELTKLEGIAQAVVCVRGDGKEAALVAYVVAKADAPTPASARLRAALAATLPAYMVPSAFVVLAALPVLPSGKVDRAALPAPLAHDAPLEAPRTATEQLLIEVWCEVLGLDDVQRSDDFFARGGHSLLAIQVVSRVARTLGVQPPVRLVFEYPVLCELAAQLQAARRAWTASPIPAAESVDDLPLSFSQEQLWMAQILEPESSAYHMSTAMRLRGSVDLDALARAFDELVRRHDALRTELWVRDGRPRQRLVEDLPKAMRVHELRSLSAREDRERELARCLEHEVTAPFELSRAPLHRMVCYRLADDEVVVLLVLHHLICDGWSMNLLASEALVLYRAFAQGLPSELPALPVRYVDVAAWQRTWMTEHVLEDHLRHFATKLGGELPTLALPLDRPRSQRRGVAGATHTQLLPLEAANAVAQFGRDAGATLNMTMLAAFLALLYRYSRQEDLVLGTTVAGRSRPEMEPLVGCFINNLVLRFDLSNKPSFRALVAQVRRETLEAYDFQALPLSELIDALAPRREPGVSPLFQVTFGVQNATDDDLRLPGAELEWLHPAADTARYDLTLWIEERGERIAIEWTYSTELFEARTISELAAAYQEVLLRGVSQPDLGLVALAIAPRPTDEPRGAHKLADSLRRVKRKPASDEAG